MSSVFKLSKPKTNKKYRGNTLKVKLRAYTKALAKGGRVLVAYEERKELKQEINTVEGWLYKRSYNLYLKSPEWHRKRNAVLERDNNKCVICGDDAQHVHHLTYKRIYNESLYDLVAVCAECHEAIHKDTDDY